MKKLYTLLVLVFALLGVNTAMATVVVGGDALSAVSDGDEILLSCTVARPSADAAELPVADSPTYYFCHPVTGELQTTNSANFLMEGYVWVAELLETDAAGNEWLLLYNKSTGKYLGKEVEPDTELAGQNDWTFKAILVDKENATPFTFKNPVDGTAFVGRDIPSASLAADYPGGPLLMPITYLDLDKRYYMMLNYAYGTAFSSYADFACWFTVQPALPDFNTSIRGELAAYIAMLTYSEYPVGDGPGYLSDKEVAQEYNEAYEIAFNAVDDQSVSEAEAEVAYERLKVAAAAAAKCHIETVKDKCYYRFVNAFEQFEAQQQVKKAMSVNGSGMAWGDLDELDINQVWYFTAADEADKFYMQNYKTKQYVTTTPGQSGQYTTTEEATNTVYFTCRGGNVFTIRTTGASYDLHAAGHNSGAGKSGTIVGWNTGGGNDASLWTIVEVDASGIAAMEEAAKQKELDSQLKTLVNRSTSSYNEALIIPEYTTIVEGAEWISSPFTESNEGSIEALIDGNTATYWHSSWQGGAVPMEEHYLQFDLQKPYNLVTLEYCRRNGAANDYPRAFVLWGSNDGSEEAVYDSIGRIEVADPASLEIQVTPSIDLKGNRYVRIFVPVVGDGVNNQRGYWHAAELNFIEGEVKPALPSNLTEAGAALLAAIETAKAVEAGATTQADIDALQAAYDAFIAAFPNPAELNALIAKAEAAVTGAYVAAEGEEELPGVNTQAQVDALAAVLEVAQAYADLEPEQYTKVGLAEQVEKVTVALNTFKTGIVMPDTKHWYHISCPTIHNDKVGYDPIDTYNGADFRCTGAVIAVDDVEGEGATSGTAMHLAHADELMEPDNALWRFVAITDSSYAIQNKATGLFINMSATTGARALTTIPGMFRFAPYADRVFNLVGTNIAGTLESCLHMQKDYHVVVAWPTRGDGGLNNGSSWQIDPVDEIAEDNENILNQLITPERFYMMCYPFGVQEVSSGNILTISYIGEDGVGFVENEEGVAPGEPFVYINDDINSESVVGFTVTDELTSTPGTALDGILVGTFVQVTPGAGCGYITASTPEGEETVECKVALTGKTTAITAGEAYITIDGKSEVKPAGEYEWFVPYAGSPLHDAIHSAIANVAPVKGIYTISGQKLGGIAKSGLYIVDGKKVMVK